MGFICLFAVFRASFNESTLGRRNISAVLPGFTAGNASLVVVGLVMGREKVRRVRCRSSLCVQNYNNKHSTTFNCQLRWIYEKESVSVKY